MKTEPLANRTLGNSDLQLTPIGFGAWAIGGGNWEFAWGAQDDADSIGAIHRALELGVNWIDTAAIYGLGHSEEIVGRALKSWSGAKPQVFTKCSMRLPACSHPIPCCGERSRKRFFRLPRRMGLG